MPETPQLDPETFDLDSWLEGAQRLRAVVTVYARRDLMAEIDQIVAELGPLDEKLKGDDAPDRSMTEAGADAARAEELRTRLREVWAQYEASGVDFELEQMASEDYDEMVAEVERQHPAPPFDASEAKQLEVAEERNRLSAKLLVIGCIIAAGPHGKPRKPVTMTLATLEKLTRRFGIDQAGELVGTARALTLESRVDAPFSRTVSQLLAESTSG